MNAPEMHSNAFPDVSKPCEECGNPFEAKRRWARFCGTPCRNEWHRKKTLGPDGRIAELERAVAELAKDSHPPFNFDDLVRRLERLERIAKGESLP